jgi:tRNA(Ile)-lysidine synthase TilS/MesJ
VLPETFPGIDFDRDGICNFCREATPKKDVLRREEDYRHRLEHLVRETRGRGAHDALMCYSGGKDSTYVLAMARRDLGLRVLALTFDNGFIPDRTFANIRKVVDGLGVGHLLLRPRFELLKRIFTACASADIFPRTVLARASSICTACMAMVKFTALKTALEKDIPLVLFGWSPGQIPLASSITRLNPRIVRSMQAAVLGPLVKAAGREVREYFLGPALLRKSASFPYFISPLAFMGYDEKRIYREVRRLGWTQPPGVDANSTNCALNSLAVAVHLVRLNFHPYAFDLAKLVRAGRLNRREALARLERPVEPATLAEVRRKLDLDAST